jgi:hypothetical protein
MPEPQGQPAPKAGEGTGTPGDTETAKPAGMTADDFNNAFSAREKSLQAKFAKEQAEREAELEKRLTESFGKTLAEQLAALKPKDDPKGKKPEEPPAPKLEDFPEWKAHQEKLAKLEKLAAQNAAERDAERAKTRATTLRTNAVQELGKVGVPADRTTHALAFLQSQGRITYADGGKGDQVVFLGDDGAEQPLTDGLKTWAKTPDAKIYLPALNPQGSGGSPGAPGGSAKNNIFADIDQLIQEQARGR